MTFGISFGQLVKRYRDAQGMSATELAREALGDEAKRSRISELENGKVKRPQAKTIDALMLHLAIPQNEIDACRKPPPLAKSELIADADLPRELLENLAQRFGIANPDAPDGELIAYLKAKASEWGEIRKRLAGLEKIDRRLANQRAAAEEAISRGKFDEADDILAAAEEIQVTDKALVEAQKAAEIRDARAHAALLADDPVKAHSHFEKASSFLLPFDQDAGAHHRHEAARALYDFGLRIPGDAMALAITLYRANLEIFTHERAPFDWTGTQNSLGNALCILGERESGTTRLEEAVEVFRLALEEWSREREPLDWAMAQNNLGIALIQLGARENGTMHLVEAVDAFHLALKERTRERVPLDWAMTQNNLGSALFKLGGRERNTARLEEAVEAFHLALKERTRKRVAFYWAATQNNLGIALITIGEWENDTARVEEAVEAYNLALEEMTSERVPLDWAKTQNNLGLAFEILGDKGVLPAKKYSEALACFDRAMEVFDPVQSAFFHAKCLGHQERVRVKLAALA